MLIGYIALHIACHGNNSKPYRYIRYSVNHTNTGSVFFSMAEFKLFLS